MPVPLLREKPLTIVTIEGYGSFPFWPANTENLKEKCEAYYVANALESIEGEFCDTGLCAILPEITALLPKDSISQYVSLTASVDGWQTTLDPSADLFNLRISLIFPNWLAKFQTTQFQNFLLNTVAQNAPAHITAELYFEQLPEMDNALQCWGLAKRLLNIDVVAAQKLVAVKLERVVRQGIVINEALKTQNFQEAFKALKRMQVAVQVIIEVAEKFTLNLGRPKEGIIQNTSAVSVALSSVLQAKEELFKQGKVLKYLAELLSTDECAPSTALLIEELIRILKLMLETLAGDSIKNMELVIHQGKLCIEDLYNLIIESGLPPVFSTSNLNA